MSNGKDLNEPMGENLRAKRHNLRSSIKKNKIALDGSLTFEKQQYNPDVTRRVSFASSSNVKPFIDDPEKNTIWHDSYEQEVIHADSTNLESMSLNKSKVHFEVYNDADDDNDNKQNCINENTITKRIVCFKNQEIIEVNQTQECTTSVEAVPEPVDSARTIIYSSPSAMEMEITCQTRISINQNFNRERDKTIVWGSSSDSLEYTCQLSPKQRRTDNKENTNMENMTIFNENSLELSCMDLLEFRDSQIVAKSPQAKEIEPLEFIDPENDNKLESTNPEICPKIIFSKPANLNNIPPANLIELLDVAGNTFPPLNSSLVNFHCSTDVGEDTQQLIQAKILTPQTKSTNESKELEKTGSEEILTSTEMELKEFLEKVKHDLRTCDFKQIINVNEMRLKLKDNQRAFNDIKQYTINFPIPTPEIECVNLEAHVNQLELFSPNKSSITSGSNNKDSVVVMNIEKNLSESFPQFSLTEQSPISLSLHEKIVNSCQKLEIILERQMENRFIFSIAHSLILLDVKIHPSEGPVKCFKTFSVLKDSADTGLKYTIANIRYKLDEKNIKSALGENYDILSLLDYTFMIVDTHFDFLCNFFKLQLKYKTLMVDEDLSLLYEVINVDPPVCWIINFNMLNPMKIDNANLNAKSLHGEIQENVIKNIAEEIPAESTCLQIFLTNVSDYFKFKELNLKKSK